MVIDLQFTTNVWSFIIIFITIYLLVLFAQLHFNLLFPTAKVSAILSLEQVGTYQRLVDLPL